VPHIKKAIRVPHGKQAEMRSVNLGGMVKIDPYKDDLFRTIIEQRRLHKSDESLYYWLKILANSIYGFFVELNPENKSKPVPVSVFSGEANSPDASDVIENPGGWFFPPLASLITSGGRLLLAMTEACVEEKHGTYLFCDTDSLAIVASKKRRQLRIPGSDGRKILSWIEVQAIVDKFAALNPYNPKIVKGSILNLVDANYADSDPKKPRRQLYGYSIAAKRYALYEKISEKDIKVVDPKAHGVGFLYPPKDSPKEWKEDVPQWTYEMWDYIVRGALNLKREAASWLNIPQMMRLSITTYRVLEMLGEWEVARPYNFLFLPMVDPAFGYAFDRRANEKVLLVAPFSSKQERWYDMECVNIHSGKKYRMVDYTQAERSCGPTSGTELRSFAVLPSGRERMQGIQCIFQGFFFFAGSVSVKDFSSSRDHGCFSFRDSLRKNPFVSFQNGGPVQRSLIDTLQAGGKCRSHNDLRIKGT
jgi:hypothetical protein